jgi:hypothetical protein
VFIRLKDGTDSIIFPATNLVGSIFQKPLLNPFFNDLCLFEFNWKTFRTGKLLNNLVERAFIQETFYFFTHICT